MDHITSTPLCWPQGWPRTRNAKHSNFGKVGGRPTIHRATRFVLDQLRMMGVPSWQVIVSSDLQLRRDGLPYSNQRPPEDQGIAVWWKDGEQQRVIALDQYTRIEDNLHAIGKTLEAMRGIERWGGGEILNRTFSGFTALPAPSEGGWREVLEYTGGGLSEAREQYRIKRKAAHPDHGGSSEQFHAVEQAWEQAKNELSEVGHE